MNIEVESLLRQLAASQAREQQLRKALEYFFPAWQKYEPLNWKYRAKQALSQPTDTTALQALIEKAGEVAAELSASACQHVIDSGEYDGHQQYAAAACRDAIRALPGVTLEDLRKLRQ